MCVLHAVSSHVNRAIIHVEERIHSQGLALPAGDDGQAFQGTSEGRRESEREGQMDRKEGLEQRNQ